MFKTMKYYIYSYTLAGIQKRNNIVHPDSATQEQQKTDTPMSRAGQLISRHRRLRPYAAHT